MGWPPPTPLKTPPEPEWLPEYETSDDAIEKATALIEDGELVLGERVLVSRWLGCITNPNDAVRARLIDIYAPRLVAPPRGAARRFARLTLPGCKLTLS